MLNPGNLSTLNTDMIDKEDLMTYARKYNLFEDIESGMLN